MPGLFVAGWAKRGPSGVIGTNKPDAVETVGTLLEVWQQELLAEPPMGQDITALFVERDIRCVDYDQWKLLDQLETSRGEAEGRPRRQFGRTSEMLAALDDETTV